MPDKDRDATDVRLTLEGDREAFGRLFDRHARGVRAVTVAVSRDFAAAEDLTQETFLRGYRRLSTLRDAKEFSKWIRGIARLVARERRRELQNSQPQLDVDHARTASTANAIDTVERDEEQRLVLDAIATLPERERLVVHAYFFSDANAGQAANQLGISRSGFYAALERGLVRVRQQLGVAAPIPTNQRKKQ